MEPPRPSSRVLPAGRRVTAAGLQTLPHCDGEACAEDRIPCHGRQTQLADAHLLNGWKKEEPCLVNGHHSLLLGPVEVETLQHVAITHPERALLHSAHIPVPIQRKPSEKADLDEVIAAAVLTSLSTSPLLLGQGAGTCTTEPCSKVSKEANLNSSSCSSSTNSGDWNWDFQGDPSIPSTPSPPLSTEVSKTCLSSTQSDDGIEDSDAGQFLFGDPIPRKRKNSVKVMFKCLWKNCGKVLSTSSGIQKHIRAVHLGRRAEPDHSDGEEDFYYTEVDVNMDSLTDGLSSLTPVSPTTSTPPVFPILEQSAWTLPASTKPELPLMTPLSLSAPTSLCHVQTDHAYQATSPVSVSAAKLLPGNAGFSFSWQPPPVLFKTPPGSLNLAHIRTVGVSEKRLQMPHQAVVKTYSPAVSAPKTGMRKPRGDAKKCRKVYGMENREMWCTACRWKKACQRFMD
ncbi:SLC2A4 regulator isoform X1 [Lissotriton helveticus]